MPWPERCRREARGEREGAPQRVSGTSLITARSRPRPPSKSAVTRALGKVLVAYDRSPGFRRPASAARGMGGLGRPEHGALVDPGHHVGGSPGTIRERGARRRHRSSFPARRGGRDWCGLGRGPQAGPEGADGPRGGPDGCASSTYERTRPFVDKARAPRRQGSGPRAPALPVAHIAAYAASLCMAAESVARLVLVGAWWFSHSSPGRIPHGKRASSIQAVPRLGC